MDGNDGQQVRESLLSDRALAEAIENLPGERVTREVIHSRIKDMEFTVLPGTTVTICNITLDNGYSVRGEAACVDPANFNAQVGAKIAYDNAFNRLWPLFGFWLAEMRHIAKLRKGG